MARADEDEIVRRSVQETKLNWESSAYYDEAEGHMDAQWRDIIHPGIRDCDFSVVLEVAPGHGRNSARLLEHAGELHLVDVNESCIEACRERFRGHALEGRIRYHVNDGASLPMIDDASVTLVYSWDAMVHFDRRVIRRYLQEFARVLVPGGRGAVHFSNYGAHQGAEETNWLDNPHWRSSMTRELFNGYCRELGLAIVAERLLDWEEYVGMDCATVFEKPA